MTWRPEAASAAEQQDPVAAVAGRGSLTPGLKLVSGLALLQQRYGGNWRPWWIYMPQAKAYQAHDRKVPAMRNLFTTLRQANPDVVLFLDAPAPRVEQEIGDARVCRCERPGGWRLDNLHPPETERVGSSRYRGPSS